MALRVLRYDDDEHYDVLSAFIKSIRGSDPDAGLYWLARMLEAGEDARLIARRLVILASEDVGLADPQGLLVADAAARAVEFVGLPEARLNLAQAVLYLARAPKSNSVLTALGAATLDVRDGAPPRVPVHLRDASLPWRGPARARRRLPVSARRARRLGRAGVPAGGGRRAPLLPRRAGTATDVDAPPTPSGAATQERGDRTVEHPRRGRRRRARRRRVAVTVARPVPHARRASPALEAPPGRVDVRLGELDPGPRTRCRPRRARPRSPAAVAPSNPPARRPGSFLEPVTGPLVKAVALERRGPPRPRRRLARSRPSDRLDDRAGASGWRPGSGSVSPPRPRPADASRTPRRGSLPARPRRPGATRRRRRGRRGPRPRCTPAKHGCATCSPRRASATTKADDDPGQ